MPYTVCVKTLLFAPVLLAFAAPVLAQTTTTAPAKPATAAKPVVHHRVPPKPCAADVAPKLPAGIPVVTGAFEEAYALKYIDTLVGTGELAPATGYFTVHYTGYLASDGKKFDSSVDRGEPITFPVGQHRVIPGWDTGFAGMHIGGKRRLFIPYELAYGETGRPPVIPPKSELIFDVELLSVSDKAPEPKPRPTPPAPPAKPAEPAPAPAKVEAMPAKPAADVAAPPPPSHGTPQTDPAHGTPQSAPAPQ
jgi:peptidylprolyl isomerase